MPRFSSLAKISGLSDTLLPIIGIIDMLSLPAAITGFGFADADAVGGDLPRVDAG